MSPLPILKYLRLPLLLGIPILAVLLALWLVQQNNVNSLAQQINALQQQIDALPATVAPKDKLSLEKDRLTLTKDRVNAQNAIYGTLVQAVGGVFFFVTAYFTYRNVKATETNVKATEEKQVTERFSKAIELLGSDKLEVRLGGIYALERIAKDSENDYWSIMEVLTAYVRENASRQVVKEKEERENFPTDLQAILTVIGRRAKAYGKDEKHRLDLSGTDLRMANLIGDGFQGVDFTAANFQMTYLRRANLQNANLELARLEGADIRGANLQKAILVDAKLQRARFEMAQLQGADIRGANLQQAFDLTEEQICQATTDEFTQLPEYLKTPEQLKQENQ